jgi:hypothetical protein
VKKKLKKLTCYIRKYSTQKKATKGWIWGKGDEILQWFEGDPKELKM